MRTVQKKLHLVCCDKRLHPEVATLIISLAVAAGKPAWQCGCSCRHPCCIGVVLCNANSKASKAPSYQKSGGENQALCGHQFFGPRTLPRKSDQEQVVKHAACSCQCVAVDAAEDRIAAGDVSGRILIWHGLKAAMSDRQAGRPLPTMACSTHHWHPHQVCSLSFSLDSAYLLSGGEEAVLVSCQFIVPEYYARGQSHMHLA